jgi:hypothetical protein
MLPLPFRALTVGSDYLSVECARCSNIIPFHPIRGGYEKFLVPANSGSFAPSAGMSRTIKTLKQRRGR